MGNEVYGRMAAAVGSGYTGHLRGCHGTVRLFIMKEKIILPLWAFANLITGMNTTMFNVTIPRIIDDLQVTADVGAWIVSSYSIGYALSTILFSRLSDSVSIRTLLVVGLLIMGGASIFGYFATDIQTLLTARVLQSAGAGTISGLGLIIITRYIPYERRGRAISVISIGRALAFGFGPLLGGIISEYFEWHGLFVVTCFVLLVLPPLLYLLPKERTKGLPFDLFGAFFTILNAVSLLVAVSRKSIAILTIGVLSLIVHKRYMDRRKHSFINPALFADSKYKKLYLIGFLMMMLNLGNLFLMPLALANLFGMSPMWIGGIIAPGAIFTASVARFIGRWIDRFADLRFLLIGQCILSVVLATFSFFLHTSEWIILC